MYKLSVQSLSFSLSLSLFFIIILHLPWLCNPLKHFTVLIFTFQLYIFPMPSQLCGLHNLSCFHAHFYLSSCPYLFLLKSLYPRSRIYPTLLILQSAPFFEDAYVFQLPSPVYMSDCFFSATALSAPLWCSMIRQVQMTSEYLLVSMWKPLFLSLAMQWSN